MTKLFNKVSHAISGAILFVLGCAMAGLGLMVMGFLALFALAAMGLAVIAAPFVAMAQSNAQEQA